MSPAWFPSRNLPSHSRASGENMPGGGRDWSLFWEAVQCMGSTWSLCLPLPAAARWSWSKHFLPFFLSFLIHKTAAASQPPFGKCFEVYGQSTLYESWYFPAFLSSIAGKEGRTCIWPSKAPRYCYFSIAVLGSSHHQRDRVSRRQSDNSHISQTVIGSSQVSYLGDSLALRAGYTMSRYCAQFWVSPYKDKLGLVQRRVSVMV